MSKSSSLSSEKTLRRQPQQKRGQQRIEKILQLKMFFIVISIPTLAIVYSNPK
jgi:hypothetical protein